MPIKENILTGKYDNIFNMLYSDLDATKERYCKAVDRFTEIFGEADSVRLFSAPGRTEVGGNHTDHQHGCVLAGSVNLDVIAIVKPNNNGIIRIKSEGYDMDTVDTHNLEPNVAEYGKAIALIRGMCGEFKKSGYEIGGFDAYTTSNVLKGSGLSSSAAFEVLVGVILNCIYNDGIVDNVEIAKIAQKAENIYFGKPCGLMDQMASSVGGFTGIDFNDPANTIIEKIDFNLSAEKHCLCIVNTGGNHADLTNDYADITVECRNVSEFFGCKFLREVDENAFYKNIAALRTKCGDRAVLRAIHFFAENKRAIAEKEALKSNDFNEFLDILKDSGDSSYKYLQNVFSPSNPNEQGLSLALALAQKVLGNRGGYRVHGGGFAGTIQAFVPEDLLDKFINVMTSAFGENTCYVLNIRPIGGTEIMQGD